MASRFCRDILEYRVETILDQAKSLRLKLQAIHSEVLDFERSALAMIEQWRSQVGGVSSGQEER